MSESIPCTILGGYLGADLILLNKSDLPRTGVDAFLDRIPATALRV